MLCTVQYSIPVGKAAGACSNRESKDIFKFIAKTVPCDVPTQRVGPQKVSVKKNLT